MENLTVDFTITADSIVAIIGIVVTIIIAIIGGIYAIVSNTKKYELTECYRQELLKWYTETVKIMIDIIHYAENGDWYTKEFSIKKIELLSQLSAQTEIGRFYFPNVINEDDFGCNKPSAYQGYRHINLELLLYFYRISSLDECGSSISILWKVQRNFTSMIFDMIEPRKRNKVYSKYTALTIPKEKSIMDFLDEDPQNIQVFRK
mgnify:CR=1 FL=1